MSFLQVTCDAARGLQCPKETRKKCTENRCTSFKPRRTHVDCICSIFRTFAVVKQYTIAGKAVVNSCLQIRENDDRGFSLKINFIRTLKIFPEFGIVGNPLGRTEPPDKDRCNKNSSEDEFIANTCAVFPVLLPRIKKKKRKREKRRQKETDLNHEISNCRDIGVAPTRALFS